MRRTLAILLLLALAASTLPLTPAHTLAGADSTAYLLSLPPTAGGCYPWLVGEGFVYRVDTGEFYALNARNITNVLCTETNIIVETLSGTFIIERSDGAVVSILSGDVIGAIGDIVALAERTVSGTRVLITSGGGTITLSTGTRTISDVFTLIGTTPVVVSITENHTLIVTTPSEQFAVDNLTGIADTIALINRTTLAVEYGSGVEILRLETVANHVAAEITARISVPLDIAEMRSIDGGTLLARSAGGRVILINIEKHSYTILADSALLAPVGAYEPASDYTVLVHDGKLRAVRGYAVMKLANTVFTVVNGTTLLVPLEPVELVLRAPLAGADIYIEQYRVKLPPLAPSVYIAPAYSLILTSDARAYTIKPPVTIVPETGGGGSGGGGGGWMGADFIVIDMPEYYVSIASLSGVRDAVTAQGLLLALLSDEAVLLNARGDVIARFPGEWSGAAIGYNRVALSDGYATYVYSVTGEKLYSIPRAITHGNILENGSIVERGGVIVRPDGTVAPTRLIAADVSSLRVYTGSGGFVAELVYRVVLPRGDHVEVSLSRVAVTLGGEARIYDLESGTGIIIRGAGNGTVILPLEGSVIAVLNSGELRIANIAGWVNQNCTLTILAPSDARVYINGEEVGSGTVLVAGACGETLRIRAVKRYYPPVEKTVRVGEVRVVRVVFPNITYTATFNVINTLDIPVDALKISVDYERTVIIPPSGEVELTPGNHTLKIAFLPLEKVCAEKTINITADHDNIVIPVECELTGAYIIVENNYKNVTTVIIKTGDGKETKTADSIPPGDVRAYSVDPGEYIVQVYDGKTLIMEEKVTVKSETAKILSIEKPQNATLTIIVNPPNATGYTIRISGPTEKTLTSTGRVQLPPGAYTITLTIGNQTITKTVTLQPGANSTVQFDVTGAVKAPAAGGKLKFDKRILVVGALASVAAIAAGVIIKRRRNA